MPWHGARLIHRLCPESQVVMRFLALSVTSLDLLGMMSHCLMSMKTISAQQAVEQFDEFSKLAHDGQRILITREGKPWVILAPPGSAAAGQPVEDRLDWPDFEAHWQRHFPEPLAGATATELLAQDKEDRF
jgi:hypothetical protein